MSINIDCTGSGNVTLRSPSTGEATFVLPGSPGLLGQVLTTDGSGILSWTTPASGTGGTSTDYPVGSKTQPGILQVGEGVNVTNGVFSVPPGSYTLKPATNDTLGGVMGGGTGIVIDSQGRVSLSGGLSGASSASNYDNIDIYRREYIGSPTFSEETFFKASVDMPSAVAEMQPMTLAKEAQFYVINFAKYWHMNSSEDCGPKLNEVLCAASELAKQMRGTSYYGLCPQVRVRVFLPVGDYFLRTQVCVPNHVELDCMGTFLRYDSGELANLFIPAIVLAPYGHLGNGQIVCHVEGAESKRGSGWLTGKVYAGSSYDLVKGGSGYTTNDVVTLVQHGQGYSSDRAPLVLAQLKVTSVSSTNGAITGYTLHRMGSYDRKLANLKPQGHYDRTLWDHDKNPDTGMLDIAVSGRGAEFKCVAFTSEFADGKYKCFEEGHSPFCQTHVQHMNAIECGDQTDSNGKLANNADPTYGYKTGIQICGKNIEINRLYTLRGRVGIWFRNGSDARVNNINTVLSGTALQIGGYTSFTCHNAAMDSSQWMGYRAYGCSGVQIGMRIFWENGNDKQVNIGPTGTRVPVIPHASGYAMKIGDTGSDGQLISAQDIRVQITNGGGKKDANGNWIGIGVFLDRLTNSQVSISYCNSEYDGRPDSKTKLVKHFIEFGNTHSSANFNPPNERLLKSTNRIHGHCTGTLGAFIIGDPIMNDLYLFDASIGGVCRTGQVYEITGAAAPTGNTGKGRARLGSRYTKTTGSAPWHYVQTAADFNFPVWAAA